MALAQEPVPEEALERLNRRLRQCGHYLYHYAAGPQQTAVLQLLRRSGPMSQQDIQAAMEIRPGSVSELITKLERKGLVTRQRDEADKRKVQIIPTPQGLAIAAQSPETALADRYAALDAAEQAQLTALLERLLTSWNTGGRES